MTTAKELLRTLINQCIGEVGKNKTIIIAVVDENGVSSTLKVSRELEELDPGHTERALITLSANFFEHFILPIAGAAEKFKVDAGEKPAE